MNKQKEIYLTIKARLFNKIDSCNRDSFGFEDQPIPKDPPPHQNAFFLCVDDGRFDQDWGGNLCSLKEQTSFTITHMKRFSVDQPKKLNQAIVEAQASMLEMKRKILVALLVETFQPDEENFPDEYARSLWRPKGSNGKFLFDSLHPKLYIAPKRHQDWPFLYHYLEFNFSHFWDL